MSQRDNFEQGMKAILIRSVSVCERRCVPQSSESDLTNFERACLGKCFDKFYAVYEKNSSAVLEALHEKKKHSEYDENF
jgi:hypothetical protein